MTHRWRYPVLHGVAAGLATALSSSVHAQTPSAGNSATPSPPVAISWGIDTISPQHRAVFELWRRYLLDRPDSTHPSSNWSAVEQRRWPHYDLTAPYLFQSPDFLEEFRATVVGLDWVPGDSTAFLIRTLFAHTDSSTGHAYPLGLHRVYAVRERGRWVLSGALHRMTAGWRRVRVGPITYVYAPTFPFDRRRASEAGRFMDSTAHFLGLPSVPSVTYYLAQSGEEANRMIGLDYALDTPGRAFVKNRLVLSGRRSQGEAYLHELAHILAAPLVGEPGGAWIFQEGLMSWLGGSRGHDYPALVRELDTVLCQHPAWTLDSILRPHDWVDSVSYGTGAVLLHMAYERRGLEGVKRLVRTPADSAPAVATLLGEVLGASPESLQLSWRRRVRELARRPDGCPRSAR